MIELMETSQSLPQLSSDVPQHGATAPLRLQILAKHGKQAELYSAKLSLFDDLSHLSPAKRMSWQRILSSVATTESLESTIMEPLLKAKQRSHTQIDTEALAYLEVHVADERRHFSLITGYLKKTFDFEKSKRTTTDQVLYDRLFPAVSRVFKFKPLYGFALLHCYEKFSVTFYDHLRSEAQKDGAQNLLTLVQQIEKDEFRHISGMEQLMRQEVSAQGGLRFGDVAAVRGILELMLLDMNMRPWALHNREVRAHLQNLNFDTDQLTRKARETAHTTLELMTGASRV